MAQHRSYCRICGAYCGTLVTTDDATGRITEVRGDKDHAMSRGYACMKGVRGPELYDDPERLLMPLKRRADGSFAAIDAETALDEIAARLRAIIAAHGPRAVATYRGTPATVNAASYHMVPAFMAAIGSPSFYSTYTIDQSAKLVTRHRLGGWAAGKHEFHDADVWLLAGNNIMVSNWTGFGAVTANPALMLKEARARGMALIVIDPRRTETAAYADIHLQLKPGTDVAVAAGLLRVILANAWHDATFCAAHVEGLDALRAAVDPFTPECVAADAGVPADLLVRAAAAFARDARRGLTVTGTGPNMAPHSNLSEHLYESLNVICGRYLRAGEFARSQRVLAGRQPLHAEVIAPSRPWESGVATVTGGYGTLKGEMMAGVLADEMLADHPDRIRALIVSAGNPANALPDQDKAVAGLRALDLLVAIDPYLSETARLADYVFPPRLPYERPDLPLAYTYDFADAFAQTTPAIAPPPAGSELIEDWYVLWSLARRLNAPIIYDGVPLDMTRAPAAQDLLAILARNSIVPLDAVAAVPGGAIFDLPPQVVRPARPGADARLAVAPADVCRTLADVAAARRGTDPGPFLLTSRRIRETMNSSFRTLPSVRRRTAYNPAYLHPDDLAELGIVPGERVRIVSAAGDIPAIVQPDAALRRGVVSMTHGYGGLPGDPEPYEARGAATPRLVSTAECVEAINAMPRMTAIPISIVPVRS